MLIIAIIGGLPINEINRGNRPVKEHNIPAISAGNGNKPTSHGRRPDIENIQDNLCYASTMGTICHIKSQSNFGTGEEPKLPVPVEWRHGFAPSVSQLMEGKDVTREAAQRNRDEGTTGEHVL